MDTRRTVTHLVAYATSKHTACLIDRSAVKTTKRARNVSCERCKRSPEYIEKKLTQNSKTKDAVDRYA
jgi:hypothetical protein